jgi:hypothetical protein
MDAKVQTGDRAERRLEANRPPPEGGQATDGPYTETKEIIASFTVIETDNYDAALAIGPECPRV